MRKTRKIWFVLTLALILIFLTPGCKQQAESADEIRVGVLRIDDSVPLYVADKDKFFDAYGLDVKIIEFGSASDQMMAASAGEIDCLMTDMVVLCLLKKGGAEFKAVATALGATPNEGRFLVVSSPDSGIKKPEDLYGATIAISENTMMDYLVEQFELLLDLDSSRISKMHVPNLTLRTEALMEGTDIQAAILPDPLAAYAVAGGANIVIDDTKLGINLSQSVIAVSARFIKEKPELVKKMIAAYNDTLTAINSEPDAYRDYCMEIARVPAEIAADYPTPSYTPNNAPSRENVDSITVWMESRGLLPEAYAYDEIVDAGFIV